MLREPGSLCSVLIMALDLAHVHAAPANSALFLPQVSFFASSSLLGGAPRRLSRPKENSKQKETRAHTQLHMLREPGLLRSVLVAALGLAHVHAAPANSALFLPEVSLFASVFFAAELCRRACCVLRRRNLAHGNEQRHAKKRTE